MASGCQRALGVGDRTVVGGLFAGRGVDRTVDREVHGIRVGLAGRVVHHFPGGKAADGWVGVGHGAGVDHLVEVDASRVDRRFGAAFSRPDHLVAVELSWTDNPNIEIIPFPYHFQI